MLRSLLVLLLLANVLYGLAVHTALGTQLGLVSPPPQTPERWQSQVNPDAIRLLSASDLQVMAAASASAPASVALAASAAPLGSELSCLQTRPLDEAEFNGLGQQLQALGLSSADWVDIRREFPARWGVLMGPFADRAQLKRKSDEIKRLRLDYEELAPPSPLAPALLLAQFGTEAEALNHLNQLSGRGVRTAKVAQVKPGSVEHRLRIDALTAEQAQRLRAQAASGGWGACAD